MVGLQSIGGLESYEVSIKPHFKVLYGEYYETYVSGVRMNTARKEATDYAVKLLSKFAGKNDSVKEIETMLGQLTDKQFDAYMQSLMVGEEVMPYIAPNLGDVRLSSEQNLKIAEELGHEFFERLWLTDPATGEVYLTPKKYLVVDLPLRRLQQHLIKKIAIPEDNQHFDEMTAQPTGPSKGRGVSFPELQLLYSQGLDDVIRELFKFRGGDEQAYRAMTKDALLTGMPSMNDVDGGDTQVKATESLSILLKSAHLDNNL